MKKIKSKCKIFPMLLPKFETKGVFCRNCETKEEESTPKNQK